MNSPKASLLALPAVLPVVLAATQPCLGQIETLVRVEQGVSDVEPIAHSLMVQPVDLRSSVDFEILFQGTWYDPIVGTRDVFARRQGALTAVFPRSSYVRTESGVIPEIPAGTIFYIGDPVQAVNMPAQSSERATANGRLDLRLDTSVRQDEQHRLREEAALSFDADMSIWTDESYRQIRVSRLLQAAARAEQSPQTAEEDSKS